MKLTKAQIQVLQNLYDGKPSHHHIHGRSAYGGFSNTIMSLFKRHLINKAEPGQSDVTLSDKGRAFIEGLKK